ncbi:MAG: hypothetical protein ACTSUE_07605 [Promethearchaeota archaeon]
MGVEEVHDSCLECAAGVLTCNCIERDVAGEIICPHYCCCCTRSWNIVCGVYKAASCLWWFAMSVVFAILVTGVFLVGNRVMEVAHRDEIVQANNAATAAIHSAPHIMNDTLNWLWGEDP